MAQDPFAQYAVSDADPFAAFAEPMASHEQAADESNVAAQVGGLLPTAGGLVGSLAGGIPGAAIGGAAGEGFRQLVTRASELPGAVADVARGLVSEPRATVGGFLRGAAGGAKNAGTQGVIQAGAEAGGRVIGKGLRAGAGRLYQSVLKPSTALRAEHPDVVQTALEHAIPVSQKGAEKAGALAETSRDAADALVAEKQALLSRINPQAATIDPRQAVGGITSAIKDVKQLPVARPQMQAIGDYGRAYLKEHPSPIRLTDAQASVRATDKFYNKAYRATMDKGNAVTSGQTSAALGINNETRNLLRAAVPKLQGQNAKTSALMGVKEAVESRAGAQANNSAVPMRHLISAGLGAGAGAVGGSDKGIATFAALEALTNPAIASRLAIAAAKGGSEQPTAQAIRQALIGLMASHEETDGR